MKQAFTFYLENRGDMSVGIWPWSDRLFVTVESLDRNTEECFVEDKEDFQKQLAKTFADFFDCGCMTQQEYNEESKRREKEDSLMEDESGLEREVEEEEDEQQTNQTE